MTRAAMKYDARSGSMSVIRTIDGKIADTKVVSISVLLNIGDADICNLIEEARQFPGREIRMPLFTPILRRAA
jgi:hypothetical protein